MSDEQDRRQFLVDKLVDEGLSEEEYAEVHRLQQKAGISTRGIRMTRHQAWRRGRKDIERNQELRRQQEEIDSKESSKEWLYEETIEDALLEVAHLDDMIDKWSLEESSKQVALITKILKRAYSEGNLR